MDADAVRHAELETAAEQVVEAKQHLIELDRRQNQYREAKRKLLQKPQEDVWLLSGGSTFVASDLGYERTIQFLEWKIQQGANEIEAVREELKHKVVSLAELEGPDSALAHLYQGFDLAAMSAK